MNVKRLATDSVFLCILIISAFTNVVIPITEIAFTLQLLVVFLICYLLPLTDSMIILLAYIVMGLIGIPVFSAGGGHRGFRDGNVLAAFHHEFIVADA